MGNELVLLGGRSGVGKTSVGIEMHAQLSAANVKPCVIDGDFLDLAHPPPWEHDLAERNLATMWQNYRSLGYRRLIYTNTVSVLPEQIRKLAAAMGDDPRIIPILLTCSDATAAERLNQRETVCDGLSHHLKSSTEMATRLDRGADADVRRLDTDRNSVAQIAEHIIELIGWDCGASWS
jgi:adenylylsulfate kinase-like enzyme